jgi:hypothetical protein
MTEETEAPLLDGERWLEVIENTEMGEEILAPLGLLPYTKGTVTTLGAETWVGKTVLGLQAFRFVAENGYRAAYCTLEMSPPLLFKRFWPQFGSEQAAKNWIQTYEAWVSHSYLDYTEVEKIIRSGFDFVVIDHIHELPFDGHEDLARKVRRIAALAPETNTAILMLSQMKQPDPMSVSPEPPTIYDFSWTKAIPEVSSVCQALWKPDLDTPEEVELVTLKNRYGAQQSPMQLRLNRETITFDQV